MSRRGTVAATGVAEVPQAIRCGTLIQPMFRYHVQNETDIQRPNMGFAGYRGLQLPSHHYTTPKRIVPRLAMTPEGLQTNGTAIGSLTGDFTQFRSDNFS
jgi:hypothetical protein